MAKNMLAVSARRRNSILRLVSTNRDSLEKKCSSPDDFSPYFSLELNMLVGLAFTAVMMEGSDVEECKYRIAAFLAIRNALYDPGKRNVLKSAVLYLLESGFSAFKKLGYPYFFDDFMVAYLGILNSINFPSEIKNEMMAILDRAF